MYREPSFGMKDQPVRALMDEPGWDPQHADAQAPPCSHEDGSAGYVRLSSRRTWLRQMRRVREALRLPLVQIHGMAETVATPLINPLYRSSVTHI